MSRLFGIPVGSLAAVLAVVLCSSLGAVAVARAAQPRLLPARPAQRPPPPRPHRADRRRADARHDDHRRRARDRRHDEPHDPLLGDHVARPDRRGRRGQGHRRGARRRTARRPATATSRRATPTASRGACAATGLVDGVAPAIVEPIAVQDAASRQTEPRVTLFATDPARLPGFGPIAQRRRRRVVARRPRPGRGLPRTRRRPTSSTRSAGDACASSPARSSRRARVKAIVRYDGGGTDGAGLLMPLAPAQRLLGKPGQISGGPRLEPRRRR